MDQPADQDEDDLDMTMAEYLKSVRQTDSERDAFRAKYGVKPVEDLPFSALDAYDAHGHHTEYGGSHH